MSGASAWAGSFFPPEAPAPRGSYAFRVGDRDLPTTAAFDSYWRFAAERQRMFFRRLRGEHVLTEDRTLSRYRFTNVYRASDRVSQFLISRVIPLGSQDPDEVFFRVILFKTFNKIATWQRIEDNLGTPAVRRYDRDAYLALLDRMHAAGEALYSAAYVMPPPDFGEPRKYGNHLRLIESMLRDRLPARIAAAPSMKDAYEALLAYPSIGPFFAYQYAIDLNYSSLTNFDEMDFVVAGPGAESGIAKCFGPSPDAGDAEIIRAMCAAAPAEFARLGLDFPTLWGRPPQLIDLQNVFCELDKYAREVHPEIAGKGNRRAIKRKYSRPNLEPIALAYPAKWRLSGVVEGVPAPSGV